MNCIERLEQYIHEDFDVVILLIKNGTIKSGKYAHLVKIKNNKKIKGKEFFKDAKNREE